MNGGVTPRVVLSVDLGRRTGPRLPAVLPGCQQQPGEAADLADAGLNIR